MTKREQNQHDVPADRESEFVGGAPAPDARRLRVVGMLFAIIPVCMLGMAYAAVPLYQMFCQVTGYGGTTRVSTKAPDRILDKTISIRFDGNVANGLSWTFKPVKHTVRIKIGETKVASYTAKNTSDKKTVGTASFNVTPESAGVYFNKIECFCFTRQALAAGEQAEFPVTFFVDPEILDDPNTRHLSEITLSYTFFPKDVPTEASLMDVKKREQVLGFPKERKASAAGGPQEKPI